MEPQSILSGKGKKLLVVNNYKFGKAHVLKCEKYVGSIFKQKPI
jgi:hypothetical protein